MVSPTLPRLIFATIAIGATVLTGGCTSTTDLPAGGTEVQASAAKGGGGPSVSQATPAWGHQGDVNEQVTITGTGFADGAVASWERGGVTDPKIVVTSTQYVSSTQLIATISIQPDAVIDFYDVAVTNPGRKKGIGYALFEVTQAQLFEGASLLRGANEAGQIVGYLEAGGAFVWSQSTGIESLPDGGPWGISEDGTIVVGGTGISASVGDTRIWTRVGGVWVAGVLPQDPAAVSHNARAGVGSDPTTGATVVIGGVEGYKIKAKVYRKPRLWLPTGSGWTRATLPGATATSDDYLNDVGASLVAVGVAGGQAAIWEPNGTGSWNLIQLGTGMLFGVNPAGTIAVGLSGDVPAKWQKVAGVWAAPTLLPSICVRAIRVDISDRIYCGGSVLLPPSHTTSIRLGGFGERGNAGVEEVSINGSWIVGSANEHVHGGFVAAYWNIF